MIEIAVDEAGMRALLAQLPDERMVAQMWWRDDVLYVPDELASAIEQARNPSLAQRRTTKAALVNPKRDAVIGAGFLADLGAAGSQRLDLRSEADAVNWIGLMTMASGLVAAGQGAIAMSLRTADNETVSPTASEVEAALTAMAQWKGAVMARSWALKDQIGKATSVQLTAIDIDSGWPG